MSISQKTLVEAISSKFHVITPFLDKVNAKKLFENFQQICQTFYAAFINSMVILISFLPISSTKIRERNFYDWLYMQQQV